jgi:4-hydroxy-tetrahydrodipicolinate synthase
VNGLFILGTTGEAPSLSYRLRRELIERVCRQTAGRVPVVVGITDTAFVESIGIARSAADAGAAAVVLSTPYYFPAGQTELSIYIRNLAAQLPLPLVLYNMPSLTKVWFEIETLERLADIELIVGIKDSSGDLAYFERLQGLRDRRPDWSLMIGPEHLLADSIRLGGDGGVAGGANVLPRLFVDCYEAAEANDEARLRKLQASIGDFQKIYEIGKYASRHIKATKCCLSLLRICDDFMAEPFQRFLPPERERVRQCLAELKLPQLQALANT